MVINEDFSEPSLGKQTDYVAVCVECQQPASLACQSCHLVNYCGSECQEAHWAQHKVDCRSPLLKEDWEPSWFTQDRVPTFVDLHGRTLPTTRKHYYYGNIPAYDVVNLPSNEGEEYQRDLNLLFAASGDLRNIITSICALPSTYKGALSIVINDLDFDVVARNVIILLIALMVEDDVRAVECMLHIWHSASIREKDMETVDTTVRPLIEEVVRKSASKPAGALVGKKCALGLHTVRVKLTKSNWDALLRFLDVPSALTVDSAKRKRTAVTLDSNRVDFRERTMLVQQQPSHRLCFAKFREDGILLPFGQSRDFTMPNPTFHQSSTWPMKDNSDPKAGWNTLEIMNTPVGPAYNDLYGKVYTLISQKLFSFRKKLSTQTCNFRLLNLKALNLPSTLAATKFSRIEVSNISDAGYIGIKQTIETFGPLLQSPQTNPHATLITLFMNATREVVSHKSEVAMTPELMRCAEAYMPFTGPSKGLYDPQIIKLTKALNLVQDFDDEFERYMEWQEFDKVEQSGRLEMKEEHTVAAKWPLRLKLEPGDEGARGKFERVLAFPHTGEERYVEWRVKRPIEAEGTAGLTLCSVC